jgi:DNA-binding NtrC family response regulator
VLVNSARITPERFEQELFGEEANGKQVRPGLLELADGGTLYLDEIADMPLSTQARILRVLTDQSFVRVGGTRQIGVDVRVVSSTTRDLTVEMAEKRFREDLFYRLNGIELKLPPLAQRPRDILPLARHFLPAGKRLGDDAERALQRHAWPGNVRELRNAVQRAALLSRSDVIAATDLALPASQEFAVAGGDEPDRATIEAALDRNGGVLAQAAADLGLSRQALYRRLDRLGIPRN